MDTRSDGPIRSQLGDDASLERLDAFVASLGERIDAIQDAERLGQLEEAAKRAAELVAEASQLALAPLAEAAERACRRCHAGDTDGAHEEIVALTHVVTRVRLGHRSGVL